MDYSNNPTEYDESDTDLTHVDVSLLLLEFHFHSAFILTFLLFATEIFFEDLYISYQMIFEFFWWRNFI